MAGNYRTIAAVGSSEIVIQKSRFIAHVARTATESEAQAFIQGIKKQYWDATHNCSAYLIGENGMIQKANDDGEPSGTAGVPMLEVLKKRQLRDVTVVVTRYFGGIKLGAGGLIRAYGSATSDSINQVGIAECLLMRVMQITVDYTLYGKVENELLQANYTVKAVRFTEHVEVDVLVEEAETARFDRWITNITNGGLILTQGEQVYSERPAE